MDALENVEQRLRDGGTHPLISLLSALFSVIYWLLTWVKSIVAFVTITLPRIVYAILSYSLTLTLNFKTLAVIFSFSSVALLVLIRYRYLNDYSTLREPPLDKPDVHELHPDVNTTEPNQTFHNYLDEFLQAIRIFGFLEKPVFHELARHLQTRRLIAGDSIELDQDKSFYCVVDGEVQVFTKTGRDPASSWDEEEDMNGYQLLNEVGSGGTLSSLFTILSLFTEDVQLRWKDDDETSVDEGPADAELLAGRLRARADSDVSRFDLTKSPSPMTSPMSASTTRQSRRSLNSSASTIHATPSSLKYPGSPGQDMYASGYSSPHLGLGDSASQPPTPDPASYKRPRLARENTSLPPALNQGTVARATVDTTLAVIPAEAFRRLTKKFPKSAAHIVQVILTRFSRVTFNAAHKYLGLTTELLRTEKGINEIACHPLPRSFYEGGGMRDLRHRFKPELRAQSESSDSEDYFGHRPFSPVSTPHSRNPSNPPDTARPKSRQRTLSPPDNGTVKSPPTPFRHHPRMSVTAGDLHTTGGGSAIAFRPFPRTYSTIQTPKVGSSSRKPTGAFANGLDGSFRRGAKLSVDDFDLRDEVMACIAKSIGLIQPPMANNGDHDDFERSPFQSDVGSGLKRAAVFNSSFGSLSMLDVQGDDSSSMTGGTSSSAANGPEYMSGLDNEVEILFFEAGSQLVRAGESNAGLFYVIDGFLDVTLPNDETTSTAPKGRTKPDPKKQPPSQSTQSKPNPNLGTASRSTSKPKLDTAEKKPISNNAPKPLFTVTPGGIAGYLASLSGIPSYVDIRAKTDAYVGFLPSNALDRLLERRPIVLLTLAKRLISLLSPLVLHIDSSLDWMQVNAGQVLWRPGEASDSLYFVINGRLRVLAEKEDGTVTIVGEYGQGDTVGELDVITSSPRRTTLHAIRDTELARMPLTLLNAISLRHPEATVRLLRMVANRVLNEADLAPKSRGHSHLGRNNINLKTVAILPAARNIPVAEFAKKLQAALEGIGAPTSVLTQTAVTTHLGRHAFSRMGKLKVAGWLADQEQRYRIVLYVADAAVSSPWVQTCIRQADCIMVVGMGDDPTIGEYERLLLMTKTTARKELVLLHPDRSVAPGTTREWLKSRPWVHAHMHVEMPGLIVPKAAPVLHDAAAVTALKKMKNKFQTEFEKYRGPRTAPQPRPPHTNDFARLARRLCGQSIGVVLGGGGARGLAHLGVLRALEEFAIPVDLIGGTSIGALIGGLYAREGDIFSSSGRAKQFSSRMASLWRLLSDVTWPVVAYTTGHEFNRGIYKCFYDLHIEDMWLPFFCNTTNILTSQMDIHQTGYAWRYIRASMTLVGLLPPLCDDKGNMLVDGGYIDNLPVSHMLSMGSSAVFAVDVGSLDDNSPRNFGDTVSGFWLLFDRWNPFSPKRNIPAIPEIQSRLAYVSSVRTLEEAKITPGCFYMQMPVQEFGTMQFSKFTELQDAGYHAAVKMIQQWLDENKLPSMLQNQDGGEKAKKKGRSLRRNSI